MTQDFAAVATTADAPMRIAVRHANPLRVWHRRLAERLRADGHRVRLDAAGPDRRGDRWDVRLLLAAERLLYRARSVMHAPAHPPIAPDLAPGETADLTIVLAGNPPPTGRWLRPSFDGTPGDAACLAALFAGRAPVIAVHGGDGGPTAMLAWGRPAIEDPHVLARSLDHVLPRLITLIAGAVARRGAGVTADAEPDADAASGTAIGLLRRGLAERVGRRLGRGRGRARGWRLAYRLTPGESVAQTRAWPAQGFTTVETADDRFQADPFPFEHEGRRHVFFEDYPFATERGVIARVEIDAAGNVSPPHVVLERPFHMSYPPVFAHRDAIYMLPETSEVRRLQLFRADPFPDRWVEDRVLLDDVRVGDATPVFHDGRWWLFGAVNDDGGSDWDQLALFHAPDIFGPWTAHAGNPVLIDAASARPAGAMWHEGGVLMRVAQDCRGGYGRGLAIVRVDRLDAAGYAQTVVSRLGPPGNGGATGVHTLNRAGRLETIDLDFG